MKQKLFLIYILAFGLILTYSFGQAKYETGKGVSFTINGTSTLHDWEMTGSGGKCSIVCDMDGSGKLLGIRGMDFSFPAKQLKSDKDAMDKNAYKALKTDKYPNITGSFVNAKVATTDNVNYKITATIKLQISGVTKDMQIVAEAKQNKDNSLTIKGEKKIDMTEFKVEPPSFMFGTVKTGKDLSIKFNLTLTK